MNERSPRHEGETLARFLRGIGGGASIALALASSALHASHVAAQPSAPDEATADAGVAPLLAPTTPIAPPSAPSEDAGVPSDAGADASIDGGSPGPDAGVAGPDAGTTRRGMLDARLPEAERPRLEVTLEPESGLRTGDVLRVTIVADAPAGAHITLPDEQRLGEATSAVTPPPVEIRATSAEEGQPSDGRRQTTFNLELSMLEPGEHQLGPFRVRVLTAAGEVGIEETEVFTVRVESVLGNEPDAEPRPPSEPVSVMEDDHRIFWALGFLLTLLLGALLAWLYRRYLEKKAREPKPPPPPRPPWEVAVEELSALAASRRKYIEDGRWDEWVDRLSDVVRGYLGARYDFEGLESTTAELMGHLQERRVSERVRGQVRELLEDCDLVKFANSPAGDEETDRMLAAGMNMVRATRPVGGAAIVQGPVVPSGSSAPEAVSAIPPTRISPAKELLSSAAASTDRTEHGADPEAEIVPTPSPSAAGIPATRVVPDTVVEESPLGARADSTDGDASADDQGTSGDTTEDAAEESNEEGERDS